uniref:K Homology domain-containing protein n=1 Tax=Chenopodium quinoa TaxID=63459 RepID=A0A803M4Q7_CHEQI
MPLPPIQYPSYPQPHYSDRPSSKRPREPVSDSAEVPSTKRQALGNDILFRVVVPSGQIGKRYEERVIIVSSRENEAGGISDAEKALLQIASLILAISGEVSAVMKAVEEIGVELRQNPPKQVISISPTYNLSIARAAQNYMDPNAAEYVTLDMVISETMVGGLIGRAGSNISRIRTESGAMIKVFGGKGEQKHRQLQLIGSAQQVALAKQRVDEYIYSQLTQQAGAEQSVLPQ